VTDRVELPIRIDDSAQGPIIRALCGAEAALMDPRRRQNALWNATPEASPTALLRMVRHAKTCARCKYLDLERRNQESHTAWASPAGVQPTD
jgi:hypothetical protein